ncbi:MAG: hypothetical protein ACP5IA_13060, partial [Sediminispirochaetaceae bacterium]
QKVRQIYAEVARDIPNAPVSEYDAAILSIFNNSITDVLVNDVEVEDAYQTALNSVLAIAD